MITLIKMSDGSEGSSADEFDVELQPPIIIATDLYNLFIAIVSATLRSVLPKRSVELLNRHLGDSLRTGESPKANPIIAAFRGTPRVSDGNDVITVQPSVLKHEQSGTVISVLVKQGVPAFEDNFKVNDQFFMSLNLLDCSREMLAYWMMRYLQDFKSEMLKYFGNENIKNILLMTKPNLKYILTLVAGLMNDDFSNSENLRDLWFIMFEWLMLCRYIELFSTIVCNAVQLQSRKTLSMSETCYCLMKKAFRDITPLNTITSTSDDAFQSSLTVFSNSMKEKVRDLETLFNAQMRNLSYDRNEFDKHVQALKVMTGFFDRRIGPKEFTSISFPRLFNYPKPFDQILHSASPTDFLSLIRDLLKTHSVKKPSSTLLDLLHEGGIFEKVFTLQIDYFRRKKELYDAEQKAIRAEIANEKSKEELYKQQQMTLAASRELQQQWTLAASRELQQQENPYDSSRYAGRYDDSRDAQIRYYSSCYARRRDDSRDAQRCDSLWYAGRRDDSRYAQIRDDSSCYAERRYDSRYAQIRDDSSCYAERRYDSRYAQIRDDSSCYAERRYDSRDAERRDDSRYAQIRYDSRDAERRYDFRDAERRYDSRYAERRYDSSCYAERRYDFRDAERRYDSPDARRR
jgi:hypothetical protein